MRTIFLALALSLSSLPAIASPSTYLYVVRNMELTGTVQGMTDDQLLQLGAIHCQNLQQFESFEAYMARIEQDVDRDRDPEAWSVLFTTAGAAEQQLCDEESN